MAKNMAGRKKDQQDNPTIPNLMGDRPQPHNLDAEKAVLSSILRDSVCLDMAIEMLGDERSFYSNIHREIFRAACELHKRSEGVDPITLAHELAKKGKLEDVGGPLGLAELHSAVATTAHFESWCNIVRDFSTLRNMINVCTESLMKCYEPTESPKVLLEQIETDIYSVRNNITRSSIEDINQSMLEAFDYIQKVLNHEIEPGIPTGYPDLDAYTGGLKPGEMFVLAARPSIGKTSIALNIIRNIALNKSNPKRIALFSLEMTAEQITRRLLCTEAQIAESRFFDGSFRHDEMYKLTTAISAFKNAGIFIDPTGGLTIAELRAKARRLQLQEKIDMIAIDYLQLMKADSRIESRQQEVAEISSGIKALAKELKIPVLVLAQLNREIEKNASANAKPKLSHLRESGAIEQDADVVAFLHRDRDEAKTATMEEQEKGLDAELIVEKNRNGQTGYIKLKFFPYRMEFVNASRYEENDLPEGVQKTAEN